MFNSLLTLYSSENVENCIQQGPRLMVTGSGVEGLGFVECSPADSVAGASAVLGRAL